MSVRSKKKADLAISPGRDPCFQMKFKEIRGDNLQNDRPELAIPACRENHFFLAALGAAVWVTAARLV
jgi:hypothetical protein